MGYGRVGQAPLLGGALRDGDPMSRRTSGKTAGAPILLGDPALAEVLGDALAQASDVDRATHGFHTWPAGLHADAARLLVEAFPGQRVLDPFVGGGTTLVEARLAGRSTFGRDLSPTALRVAWGRTASPDEAFHTRARSYARRITEAARQCTEPPDDELQAALGDWYAPHALVELASLKRDIAQADPDIRPLLEVCFSSILVKVSWRRSDTSARREKHHRPPGTAAILFHKKVRELCRRQAALREAVPEGTPDTDLALGDARRIEVPAPVDLVLTSPPYPSTYDYLPMQTLRTIWFSDRPMFEREIGARRDWKDGERDARKQWRRDTNAWMAAAGDALSVGGHLVVVIGDGLTPTGVVDTSKATEQAAHTAGLASVARASVERDDHARGTTRWEHILVYQKEPAV